LCSCWSVLTVFLFSKEAKGNGKDHQKKSRSSPAGNTQFANAIIVGSSYAYSG